MERKEIVQIMGGKAVVAGFELVICVIDGSYITRTPGPAVCTKIAKLDPVLRIFSWRFITVSDTQVREIFLGMSPFFFHGVMTFFSFPERSCRSYFFLLLGVPLNVARIDDKISFQNLSI